MTPLQSMLFVLISVNHLCTSCTDGKVCARGHAAEDRADRVQSGLAVRAWS